MIDMKIIDNADQQFGAVFNDQRVTLRVRYNTSSDRWSFDLAIDDDWVLLGRRIVTKVDLLRAYSQVDLGILFSWPITPGAQPDRNGFPQGLVGLFHEDPEEEPT
jgi:hypothetical protein